MFPVRWCAQLSWTALGATRYRLQLTLITRGCAKIGVSKVVSSPQELKDMASRAITIVLTYVQRRLQGKLASLKK